MRKFTLLAEPLILCDGLLGVCIDWYDMETIFTVKQTGTDSMKPRTLLSEDSWLPFIQTFIQTFAVVHM